MKLIIIISVLISFSSCNKIQSQLNEASSEKVDLQTPLASDDQSPAATEEFSIYITSDDSKISIDFDKIHLLKEVVVLINAKDQGAINSVPFLYSFSAADLASQFVNVKVSVVLFDNRTFSKTSRIEMIEPSSNPPSNQPSTGGVTEYQTDVNCMEKSEYDACLFYKNPVAHKKSPFTTKIKFDDNLDQVQTYAVKILNRTDAQYLKNASIDVFASSGVKAKIDTTNTWKAYYKDDFGVHKLAQVLSYFWADAQISFMKAKGGAFYAENKNIKIDAFNNNVNSNAYWNGSSVVLGNFGTQEIALSSEVLLHELGHANLDFATNRQIRLTSSYCPTKMGCIGAIHEGQADIHAFLFFKGDSKMSQTITNTTAGWANRNPANLASKNLDYFFNTHSKGGEIHGMGTAYATILWQIMTDTAMNQDDFAKMFTLHLPRLTNSSNFQTAKTVWLNLSQVHFNSKYNAIIQNYFSKMGVN